MQLFPPFDENDEKRFLEQGSDTDNQWAWSDMRRRKWEVVTDEYQQFYEHWRKPSTTPKFLDTFPYELPLKAKPPFRPENISGDRILITKAYDDMFHRLLRLRMKDEGCKKGAVLTGQPGVGKSTFLNFMLAQLISAHQVVLVCKSSETHLFYHGQVYSRSTGAGLCGLPTRQQTRYCPIWALIDVDYQDRGPPIDDGSNIWPIQVSSPKPVRWKSWSKQNGAAQLGMSLWNIEELTEGLRLQAGYNTFRNRLEQSLPYLDGPMLSTTGDESIDAVLKVLWTERGRDQDETQVDADQSQTPVDNALKILVQNATEEFGFAPRDVYNGVLNLSCTRDQHAAAVEKLNYSRLKILAETFSDKLELDDFSHRVVVVYPIPFLDSRDKWAIDFKSAQIARNVVESMRLEEDKHLQEAYSFLRKIRESSTTLSRWVFEAIAHRMLSKGRQSEGRTLEPMPMVSDDCNPPAFSIGPSSTPSTPGTSLPSPAPLHSHTRAVTRADFTPGLSDVTLDNDRYYIPATTNNPLFDSFTIDPDFDRHTVAISIFQITTSSMHGGSAKGYSRIRKIMAHVRALLKKGHLNATVKVAYFLVCPDDGSEPKWQMPGDWDKGITVDDNRGEAFCIRVPVATGRGKKRAIEGDQKGKAPAKASRSSTSSTNTAGTNTRRRQST